MKRLRVLALLLAAAMVAGSPLFAEGTAEKGAAGSQPVTLKIYGQAYWGGPWQNGISDDPVAKLIRQDTGVSMDIEQMESGTYETKLSAMIAAGDLPDIVGMRNKNNLNVLIQNKQIIPLDALVASHGRNIAKYTPEKIQFSKKFLSSGTNNLYILPSGVTNATVPQLFNHYWYFRWDLYKQLGYPKYKDMYEFLGVLKRMQDLEPTNAEGKKVYALSPWLADWGLWNMTVLAVDLGIYAEFPGLVDFDLATNAVTSQILNDNSSFWQTMKWWYTADKMGILDPESVTQKFAQVQTKGAANRILCGFVDWPMAPGRALFAKNGTPEKDYLPSPPWTEMTRFRGENISPYGDMGYLWAVSSNCKTPDRAVALLNWFHNPMNVLQVRWGVRGDAWDIENGLPTMKDSYFVDVAADPDYELPRGIDKYSGLNGMSDGYLNPDTKRVLAMSATDKWRQNALNPSARPAIADLLDHYKIKFPTELAKNVKILHFNNALAGLLPDAPDDIKLIQANIQPYVAEASLKLVLAKNDAEYQAIAKEIKDKCIQMGVQKMTDFYVKSIGDAVRELRSIK